MRNNDTYDCAVNALIRMYLRHHSNQECGTPTCGELMRLEACCAKCEVRLEACYAKCPNSFLIHYPPPPVPDPLAPQPLAPPHPAPHAAHSQWLAAGSCRGGQAGSLLAGQGGWLARALDQLKLGGFLKDFFRKFSGSPHGKYAILMDMVGYEVVHMKI